MTTPQKLIGISALILFFVLLFYWFQIRPSQIKSSCAALAMSAAVDNIKHKSENNPDDYQLQQSAAQSLYSQKTYENYYTICLHRKGL